MLACAAEVQSTEQADASQMRLDTTIARVLFIATASGYSIAPPPAMSMPLQPWGVVLPGPHP